MIKQLQAITNSNKKRTDTVPAFYRLREVECRYRSSNNTLRSVLYLVAISGILIVMWARSGTCLASEYEGMDASLMDFVKSCAFNFKGFDIKIKDINIRETYDDNVTYAKEEAKEDFITNLGIGIAALYEGKKDTFEVSGNVIHEAFAENSIFDNTTQYITLGFKRELSQHDRVSLKNAFYNDVTPLFFEGPSFSANKQASGRIPYYKNRCSVDYARDVSRQLTFKVKYASDVDAFETKTFLDSFVNKAGLEANYMLSGTTILLTTYDFSNRQFEDKQNASINTIAQGLRQYITKKLYFDIGGGLDFVDSYKEDTFIDPVILSALTYDMGDNTQFRLLFNKKDDTKPFDQQISSYRRTALSVTRQMSERLGGGLSLSYDDVKSVPANFEQKILNASSSLIYDINRNLKGRFTYTYSEAVSSGETSGYTKNTVLLGLEATF